jgi:hypothetical protein
MSDRNQGNNPSDSGPERPRSEPEIIPPDRAGGRPRPRVWVSVDEGTDGVRRVYVAQPGPFTLILALVVLGLIAAIMLMVLLSVALIWIPVVIVLVATVVLTVTFRQYWWRFRNWLARR